MAASPQLEVADVVRRFGARLLAARGASLSREQRRVLGCLAACRTATLGGHLYQCDRCGYEHPVYNSCRDRHCPKCGALASERWLEARSAELLPVPYFHLVATIPEALHALFLQNQRALYDLLFRSVASSLLDVAADPRQLTVEGGARIGCLATLHTWNQAMLYHPHVHMIVPGGGLTVDGLRWVGADPDYLVPVQVLSRALRGRLLAGIKALHADDSLAFHGKLEPLAEPRALARHLEPLWHKEWVVYLKPPFAGPRKVLEYLARYTHGIAISKRRHRKLEPCWKRGRRRRPACWATIPCDARPAARDASRRLRRSDPTPGPHRPGDPRHETTSDRAPDAPILQSQGRCAPSQKSCRLPATQ